jgi:hypothetical protein
MKSVPNINVDLIWILCVNISVGIQAFFILVLCVRWRENQEGPLRG